MDIITPLDLPKAPLNLSRKGDELWVKCFVRKKKIVCTPEEWVRQHVIHFLLGQGISLGLIGVEVALNYHGRNKRADVVVFGSNQKPRIVIECKAPDVVLSEAVLRQIASYNHVLEAEYLMMTNGLEHVFARVDLASGEIVYYVDFPPFFVEKKTDD